MSFAAFFDTSPSMVGLLLVGEMVVLYQVSLIPSNEMCKDYKSSFTKIVASLAAWKAMGIRLPTIGKNDTFFILFTTYLHEPPYDLVTFNWEPFP
jgi:hypothetical protein